MSRAKSGLLPLKGAVALLTLAGLLAVTLSAVVQAPGPERTVVQGGPFLFDHAQTRCASGSQHGSADNEGGGSAHD